MTEIPSSASPLHSPEGDREKQTPGNHNTIDNRVETASLKALANQILQRNEARIKGRTTASHDIGETSQIGQWVRQSNIIFIPPSIKDNFEERIAIAEYDGQQNSLQAHRIAYEGAMIVLLNTNPPDDLVKPGEDWLKDRIKSAEDCLTIQGITRPS